MTATHTGHHAAGQPYHFKHGWIPIGGEPKHGDRSADRIAARALGHEGSRPISDAERDSARHVVGNLHPRKIGNDRAASDYLAANAGHLPGEQKDAVNRYTGDGFFELNKKLRSGDASDPEVGRLDKAFRPLPDDLILTRHVHAEAFGLTPQTLSNIEGLKGSVIADRAYQSTALGSPYGFGLGGITLKIATPKGTPAVITAAATNNPHEREVMLDRGQKLVITSVTKNDRYGYDVSAVAIPGEA